MIEGKKTKLRMLVRDDLEAYCALINDVNAPGGSPNGSERVLLDHDLVGIERDQSLDLL